MHAFSKEDGTAPFANLILGCDGKLYGTASSGGLFNAGTVFVMAPTGEMSVLHAFTGRDDGGSPVSGLMKANDCSLYGTTPGRHVVAGHRLSNHPAGLSEPGGAGGEQIVSDGLVANGDAGVGGLNSATGGVVVDGDATPQPAGGYAGTGTGGSGGATWAVAGNSGMAGGGQGGTSMAAGSGVV